MASRTSKSSVNSIVGITCSLISSILSFLLQAIFIRLLGLEYSGINSLFGSILSMLNIVDLGVSNAILFHLYKQIADKNQDGIDLLVTAYKRVCWLISGIIGIAGICCIPFLGSLVKEPVSFPESLWSLYIIVLATSVVQHLFDYRSILIIANQDRYIKTLINYGFLFLCHGLQILVLLLSRNIYLYLLVKLVTTASNGILSGYICKKKYNSSWYSKDHLPREQTKELIKQVGSLAVYKFCRTLDASIDTFLISKFVAVATTAIYGSYTLILNALTELLGSINDGMLASIGDLFASGDRKRMETVFYETTHLAFFIYGVCTAALAGFLSEFTMWWIGYTLPPAALYVMLANFYMYGIGMNIATFRNSMGIFTKGWKRPAVTAFLNFVFSVFLTSKIGLLGTLIGTLLARISTGTWFDPYLVCKYGMGIKPFKYYYRYVCYLLFTACTTFVVVQISLRIPETSNFLLVMAKGVLYGIISLIMIFLLGSVFSEQKELIRRVNIILHALSKKVRRKQ